MWNIKKKSTDGDVVEVEPVDVADVWGEPQCRQRPRVAGQLQPRLVEVVAVEDQVAFVPMKRSSPVVMAMDPRNEPQIGNPSISKADVDLPRPPANGGRGR